MVSYRQAEFGKLSASVRGFPRHLAFVQLVGRDPARLGRVEFAFGLRAFLRDCTSFRRILDEQQRIGERSIELVQFSRETRNVSFLDLDRFPEWLELQPPLGGFAACLFLRSLRSSLLSIRRLL